MKADEQNTGNRSLVKNEADQRAIRHLRDAVRRGRHWYLALLESIKLWNSAEEHHNGRHYKYLIDGEAFDWLLLAERLLTEVKDDIDEDEMIELLFFDRPPVDLTKDEFRNLIGQAKYRAYLNYSYGVLVEESLIYAVVNEVRKDKRSLGANEDQGVMDRAFKIIYGAVEEKLISHFIQEKGYNRRKNISLGELNEFYYWLFKYRLKHNDSSRVASDTKKALLRLQNIMARKSGH